MRFSYFIGSVVFLSISYLLAKSAVGADDILAFWFLTFSVVFGLGALYSGITCFFDTSLDDSEDLTEGWDD